MLPCPHKPKCCRYFYSLQTSKLKCPISHKAIRLFVTFTNLLTHQPQQQAEQNGWGSSPLFNNESDGTKNSGAASAHRMTAAILTTAIATKFLIVTQLAEIYYLNSTECLVLLDNVITRKQENVFTNTLFSPPAFIFASKS